MKIILLAEHLDIRRGGLERWASRFIQWLTVEGHRVAVMAISRTDASLPPGVPFHALPNQVSRMERAAAAADLIQHMDAELVYDLGVGIGADILHPQFGSRVICAEAELRSQPVWFQWWKQLSPAARRRQNNLKAFEDAQYRGQSGLIISPSRFAADPLIHTYRLNRDLIHVIYNGVEPSRFYPDILNPLRASTRKSRGLELHHVHLLQVAVNFNLKGVDTVLRAVAKLPTNVHYTIVGGGRIPAFHHLARTLGVADRVHFAGASDDPRSWFASADIYVHPTRHDAGSLSVLEAWASGIPVITTWKNGSAEIMTEGRHGFVMDDPENEDGLVRFVNQLCDADIRKEMAVPCRVLAGQYSFNAQFQKIAGLARELIASGRATGRLLRPGNQ